MLLDAKSCEWSVMCPSNVVSGVQGASRGLTFEELLRCEINTPVLCADGKVGTLIRWHVASRAAGVQVFVERNMREIPCGRLKLANGMLLETTEIAAI